MNNELSSAFEAGSGVTPESMKLVILCICAALMFLVAMWLVSRILQDYRSRDIDAAEALHGIAYIAVPLVLLVALLAWI